jgi:hypothetical protein
MARLDTGWHVNPKVLQAGAHGMALHAWSISYCDHALSDGFIPAKAWPSFLAAGVRTLLRLGLWSAAEGGYRLHDYLDYNRSRDQVYEGQLAKHDARVRAGRAGGLASGKMRSKDEANGQADAKQNGSKHPSKPEANTQAKPKQNEAPFPEYATAVGRKPGRPDPVSRARGDGDLQPLAAVLPDEVRARLSQSPITTPAASPATHPPT